MIQNTHKILPNPINKKKKKKKIYISLEKDHLKIYNLTTYLILLPPTSYHLKTRFLNLPSLLIR